MSNHDDRRRRAEREAARDVTAADSGGVVYHFTHHRPPAEEVDLLGLTEYAERLAEAEAESVRAVNEAGTARKTARDVDADPLAPAADKDAAEIEATAAAQKVRPALLATRKAAVAHLVAYREALQHPDARRLFREATVEQHKRATSAWDEFVAALDARERAYERIGQPHAPRHWRSEAVARGLPANVMGAEAGRLGDARRDLTYVVSTFPARQIEADLDEEAR